MTMDTQSLPRGGPRGGSWGCAAPPSPTTGAVVVAGLSRAVPVIRGPHSTTPDSGARSRTRSRSRSPDSSESVSSECSQGRADRLDRLDRAYGHRYSSPEPQPPLAGLRDGLGVIGYPYPYSYPYCDAAPGPPSLAPPLALPTTSEALDALEAVTALSDLYAPHAYPYPLRPLRAWLPWRGLAAPPLTAPHRAAPAPPPGPALKFGMDRILADDGCGATARRDTVDSTTACSRDMATFPIPGLLAPTPLRIYSHAGDVRAPPSPPSAPHAVGHGGQQAAALGSHVGQASSGSSSGKRKRSWSRAVFSNLQRKGLEKRFQLQKYITKPDRRQLAATLGLTDAQVKVWFQNRRMKWRHTKESKQLQPPPPPRLDDLHEDLGKRDVVDAALPRTASS